MADQIKVTFGSLDTAEADLTAGHAAMGHRLADLKANIQPMISTWEGSAQAAYYAHQQQWDTAWDELTMALGGGSACGPRGPQGLGVDGSRRGWT